MKRRNRSLAWVVLALCSANVPACLVEPAQSDRSSEDSRSASSALARGTPTGDAELRAVAGLATPRPGGCTATLVADRIILTAAHCVAPFGSGCPGTLVPPQDIVAVFADGQGNPLGADAQRIRVVAFTVHPDAWADRVTACANPNPLLPNCPADVSQLGPSCNLVEQCQADGRQISIWAGFHEEHDLALGYLESAPVGIVPLPVIVSQASNPFAPNLFSFPGLDAFLDTRPYVTLVGYGGGSTDWDPGPPWRGGRDFGTAPVSGRTTHPRRWDRCDGVRTDGGIQPSVNLAVDDQRDAYTRAGDSGGPVLVGPGMIVEGAMSPATDLPASSGLTPRRYVIGVNSTGGDQPVPATPCNPLLFCDPGQACVHVDPAGWGQCAIVCADDQACPPNAACILDPAGVGHCMAVTAYAASTFDAGNGAWLRSAIDDIDRDGRPNAQDNCPGVPNPLQENCNRDAERDRRGDELGDACDPVPCPKARSPVVVETLLKHHTTGCAGFEQVRRVRSRIEPDVLASRNLINGVELAQQQQITQFRFCHVEFPVRTCSVNANQRRDQDFDTLDNFQSNWRDVTLPLLGAPGAFTSYDYPSVPAALDWSYWDDRTRWLNDGWLTAVSTPAKPISTPEKMWFQSSGLWGAFGLRAGGSQSAHLLGTMAHPANGIHFTPDLGDGFLMGEGLGRAYIDPMGPDPIETRIWDRCLMCAGAACLSLQPFPIRLPDWTQGGELGTDPTLPPWWRDWPRPFADGPIEAMLIQGQSGWGPVDEDGRILQIEGLLSQGLVDDLSDPELVFVRAAEPHVGTGRAFDNVQGLLLRSDATAIKDRVVVRASGLMTGRERPPVDVWDMQTDTGPALGVQQTTNLPGITPRTGFAAVLSRTLGAAVLAGGRDSDGVPTHQTWMVPLEGSEPFLLDTPGYQPVDVVAATVATSDGMLWVLDEVRPFAWLRMARIVRIDTLSGRHEMVWQSPRLGVFDRHWLAVDRDGQVLLFASSGRLKKHVTVRFEATPFVLGTAKPRLVRLGQGDLLGEPLIDAHGYQYITRRGNDRLDVQRIRSLDQPPHHGIHPKECL